MLTKRDQDDSLTVHQFHLAASCPWSFLLFFILNTVSTFGEAILLVKIQINSIYIIITS